MKQKSAKEDMGRQVAALGCLFALLGLPAAAGAAGAAGFFELEEGVNIVGAGVGQTPDYQGSDDYATGVAPFGRYYFSGERYINLLGPQLSVNIVDDKVLQFGPVLMYRFGRDSDVDDAVVARMTEIDDAVEAGAFVAASIAMNDNDPRERLILSADLLADASGTHDGWITTAGVKYWYPVSRMIVTHFGGGIAYASEDFTQTYYGVRGADVALFPGLGGNAYNPDGGMHDVRVTAGAIMHLSPNWHLGVGVRYQALQGDAEDSPVVDQRGDSSQWIYGVGLGYAWQ